MDVALVIEEKPPADGKGKVLRIAVLGQLEEGTNVEAAVAGLGAIGLRFNVACAPERLMTRPLFSDGSCGPWMRPLANLSAQQLMSSLELLKTPRIDGFAFTLAKQILWQVSAIESPSMGVQAQALTPAEALKEKVEKKEAP